MFCVRIAASVVLLCIGPAFGQDERKSFSVDDVVSVYRGLSQIGQYQGICKDGGGEKQCVKDYDLGMPVRMKIARNIDRAKSVVISYDKAKQDLVMALSKGGARVPDEKMAEFNNEDRKTLDSPSGIMLDTISCLDLKLSSNPIPGPTLSMIWSILTDTDKCN